MPEMICFKYVFPEKKRSGTGLKNSKTIKSSQSLKKTETDWGDTDQNHLKSAKR